jgi:hypothetical protein
MPSNFKSAIREAEENYFDFALTTLFKESNFRDDKTIFSREIAQSVPDSVLQSGYWQTYIFGKVTT